MPNEEPSNANNQNELLLQLVSALLNQGQSQVEQPALNTQFTGPQQVHGIPTTVQYPQNLFTGYGTALNAHSSGFTAPAPSQLQHYEQLPNVGSSVDLHGTDHYEEHPYSFADRGQPSAADRRDRIRLKNRLAQQRFRERRRAQQRDFDRLVAEYDALELEQDALKDQEQALRKLFHVKHSLISTLMAVNQSAANAETEKDGKIEEKGDATIAAVPADDDGGTGDKKAEENAESADRKTAATTMASGNDVSGRARGTFSKSFQAHLAPTPGALAARSIPEDARKTELFSNLQAWQAQLGALMEKGASLGFPAEHLKNLEMATQRQLVEWEQLAQEDGCEYSKMLHHVLAPRDMRSPSNNSLAAGTVAPETLAAVFAGISDEGLVELQKIKESYETNLHMGYAALQKWKTEVLPLMILSYLYGTSDVPPGTSGSNLDGSGGSGSTAAEKTSKSSCACELATRHLMVGAGIAHLQTHEKKVWDAVSLIGPAWSRIAGPLNSALCHLEVAPFVPSPDVMASSILALTLVKRNEEESNQDEQQH